MNASPDYSRLKIGTYRFRCDCKPDSRSKPLSVTVTAAGVSWWKCFRCGDTGYDGNSSSRPIAATPSTRHTTLSDYGQEIWRTCRRISDTARDYLLARRCVIPPTDSDLKWHPKLKHSPSGYCGPALVGLVSDAITGRPLSLHRTWIKPNGCKPDVSPPRMFLKDHTTAGGVIRLWPDESVNTGLSIGEGVETCLAAAHGATPVWCCLDAGNLGRFPVLAGIDSLIIFADHDEAGIGAANACAARWATAAEVLMVLPAAAGTDIADSVAT